MTTDSTANPTLNRIAAFDDSKRVVANLMARENITVQVVDGVPTAMFNPATRVLTIPAWGNLSVDQLDTFIAHEIGHALFTTSDVFEKLGSDRQNRAFFHYVNIVEDARIERRMRESFPGLVRIMHRGWQELFTRGPIMQGNATGLINPRTKAVVAYDKLKLIDRINAYYKIGAFAKIPFTAEESEWIRRIDRCGSMEQAIEIARALYQYAKEQATQESAPSGTPQQQQGQKGPQGQPESGDETSEDAAGTSGDDQDGEGSGSSDGEGEGDEDGDASDSDEASTSGTANTGAQGAGANADDDGDVDSDFVDAIDEAMRGLAKRSDGSGAVRNLLLAPVDDHTFAQRTVHANAWVTSCYDVFAKETWAPALLDALAASWESQHLATAKLMALEFERRKTARALQHARIAKTGKLNLGKLAQYKFTDDLFMRTMSVPQGKSHGVVMVIDASGSMQKCFAHVIDQVLLFAYFAYQVNIPFEAYMFTDRSSNRYGTDYDYDSGESRIAKHRPGLHSIGLADTGRLVGLVNTRTDRGSFKRQVRACLALRVKFAEWDTTINGRPVSYAYPEIHRVLALPYSDLGGTPLYTGMMLGEKALANLKAQAGVEKTTFVLVTDGEDGAGLPYQSNDVNQYTGTVTEKRLAVGATPFVVRDTVTKKTLVFAVPHTSGGFTSVSVPANAVMTMLLDVMKLRHDTRTIYLYLQSGPASSRLAHRYYYNTHRGAQSVPAIDGLSYAVRGGQEAAVAALGESSMLATLKDDGQYVLPQGLGVADYSVLLRVSRLTLADDAFAKLDTNGMTQRKIAAEFTKAMVKGVANRVFVNTLTPALI
jgi:hypothetical protein